MTKIKHKFVGEAEAGKLVKWLNAGQSTGAQRIAEIVELYNNLGKSGAMYLRLQQLLNRYTYKFKVIARYTILDSAKKLTGDAFWESFNQLNVQKLRQMRLLSRVKRCGHCKEWMFAKLPGQRFCKESCRIKAFQSDEKWRARNNKKRRENYDRLKRNGLLEGRRDRERKGTK